MVLLSWCHSLVISSRLTKDCHHYFLKRFLIRTSLIKKLPSQPLFFLSDSHYNNSCVIASSWKICSTQPVLETRKKGLYNSLIDFMISKDPWRVMEQLMDFSDKSVHKAGLWDICLAFRGWGLDTHQFSVKWIQGKPQSHGTPLALGDCLHSMWVLSSGREADHTATLWFDRGLRKKVKMRPSFPYQENLYNPFLHPSMGLFRSSFESKNNGILGLE